MVKSYEQALRIQIGRKNSGRAGIAVAVKRFMKKHPGETVFAAEIQRAANHG